MHDRVMRLLVHCDEPVAFAYATSRDSSFYLLADDSFWAYEDGDVLLAAGTREPIARRDRNVFYRDGVAVFFEE